MKRVTIVFPVRDAQVMLAMKKRGHGEGKWNGAGGKAESGESIESAAIRECREEIGITPTKLEKVAELSFLDAQNQPDQEAHVFICREWEGEPAESEEMRPKWFAIEDIPYSEMWDSDLIWVKKVLAGKHIKGEISFDELGRSISYTDKEVESL